MMNSGLRYIASSIRTPCSARHMQWSPAEASLPASSYSVKGENIRLFPDELECCAGMLGIPIDRRSCAPMLLHWNGTQSLDVSYPGAGLFCRTLNPQGLLTSKKSGAMSAMSRDSSNAFLPDGPEITGAAEGPLQGLTFAAKDLYDVSAFY